MHNKQERKRKEQYIKKKKKEQKKKRRIRGDDVGGDNHVQETRLFFPFTWPFFLLKYSFRRAMLQLEFGKSNPEESQSEQSITEARKAASCSSETLKSNTGSGPSAAGCPVSNPDNLWKSPLLVLWRQWMHLNAMHPVMSENQFHCTSLCVCVSQ